MLILAGLLGMLALGSIMLIEPSTEVESDDVADENEPATDSGSVELENASMDLLSFLDEESDSSTQSNNVPEADDPLSDAGDSDEANGANGDVLQGSEEGDELSGGEGDDTLFGNGGIDELSGGGGNDNLSGGDDPDALWGGQGEDTLYGDDSDDILDGGDGADLLIGGTGDDILNGAEDDEDSADTLNGGAGDDTILAGVGDQVSGGQGADTTVLNSDLDGQAQILDFESGQDTLVVLYDSNSDMPNISISQDPETADQWLVQADGVTVANVAGDAPTLADISLIENVA